MIADMSHNIPFEPETSRAKAAQAAWSRLTPRKRLAPVREFRHRLVEGADALGAAEFRRCCATVGVKVQEYSHRGDLPCGSTIGPLSSAQLSVRTVDVGMPQLSMHSARELMAVEDVGAMVAAFSAWLAGGS